MALAEDAPPPWRRLIARLDPRAYLTLHIVVGLVRVPAHRHGIFAVLLDSVREHDVLVTRDQAVGDLVSRQRNRARRSDLRDHQRDRLAGGHGGALRRSGAVSLAREAAHAARRVGAVLCRWHRARWRDQGHRSPPASGVRGEIPSLQQLELSVRPFDGVADRLRDARLHDHSRAADREHARQSRHLGWRRSS